MSDKEEQDKQSGKQLATKQRPQSTEERQLEEAITNRNVDVNARTSTLTGDTFNPNKPNIVDGFKPSQVLVNDKGEEI